MCTFALIRTDKHRIKISCYRGIGIKKKLEEIRLVSVIIQTIPLSLFNVSNFKLRALLEVACAQRGTPYLIAVQGLCIWNSEAAQHGDLTRLPIISL